MGATTLEKLQNDESQQAAADQKRRAEAVAKYRKLVAQLADGKESPEAAGVLAAVGRSAGQLAAGVESYRQRRELLTHARSATEAAAKRTEAHTALNRFINVERPATIAGLDERKRDLEAAVLQTDLAMKDAIEAQRQLLEGSPLPLRARVKDLDDQHRRLRADASGLCCKAHELELFAAQADGYARRQDGRDRDYTSRAAEKRKEAKGLESAALKADHAAAAVQDEINQVLAEAIVPGADLDG